jgi:hypothetical protein
MFHSNTERLIEYWRAQKVGAASPLRSAIDPSKIATLLPQVFVLGRLGPGRCAFRLAGGLLGDLHQRDLRQTDWLSLWQGSERMRLATALETARQRAEPIVITAQAHTASGRTAMFEIALAPLRGAPGQPDRFIGLYQPVSPLARLLGEPITIFSTQRIGAASRPVEPYLKLAAVDGRRVA